MQVNIKLLLSLLILVYSNALRTTKTFLTYYYHIIINSTFNVLILMSFSNWFHTFDTDNYIYIFNRDMIYKRDV